MKYRAMLIPGPIAVLVASGFVADAVAQNLFTPSATQEITVVAPEHLEPLERFAVSELAGHIEQVSGQAPKMSPDGSLPDGNVVVIGQVKNNGALSRLAAEGSLQVNREEQGYSIRIDRNPRDATGRAWLAVLCGADPHGVLYAVRDFSHYYFFKDDSGVVLRRARMWSSTSNTTSIG